MLVPGGGELNNKFNPRSVTSPAATDVRVVLPTSTASNALKEVTDAEVIADPLAATATAPAIAPVWPGQVNRDL